MSEGLVSVMKNSDLFSNFTPEQLEQAVLHLNPQAITVKGGERIFSKGDTANSCWLIESGKLTIERSSLRTPFLHKIYKKGFVTGIQGLVDPGSKHAISMIADGDVKLVEVTHEGVARLNQETQLLLWQNISRILLRKLTNCLSQESLDQRA